MTASQEPAARRNLRLAAALVTGEGLVLLGYGIAEFASVTPGRVALGVSTATFFCVTALGLLLAGRGLWRRASWSRGPVVLAQLLALGVAWSLKDTHLRPLSVGLGVVAIVVLVAVLAPATTAALGD